MKALILQMRGTDDPSREVERAQYLTYTGLSESEVDFVDLYEHADLDPLSLLNYDVLFIGGISKDEPEELSWPKEKFPFIQNLRASMQLAIDKKIPAFLSCGGFVIAGDMLGGETLAKLDNHELGVIGIQKAPAAEKDILLAPISSTLPIVCGHIKYFEQPPPGTELLYFSDTYEAGIPLQAFKVKGAPFYAFQGHPEISSSDLFDRIKPMMYRKHYFPKRKGHPEDEKYGYNHQAFLNASSIRNDTTEAQNLLRRFVDLVRVGAFSNED